MKYTQMDILLIKQIMIITIKLIVNVVPQSKQY
jgi:hypothetical protein